MIAFQNLNKKFWWKTDSLWLTNKWLTDKIDLWAFFQIFYFVMNYIGKFETPEKVWKHDLYEFYFAFQMYGWE